MKNLKDQLAGIAALIAAILAIGGGFATYGKLTEKINVLVSKSSADYSAQIAVLEEKVAKLENVEGVDLSSLEDGLSQNKTKSLVNAKEIELLKVQIEEIKVSTSNPLAN